MTNFTLLYTVIVIITWGLLWMGYCEGIKMQNNIIKEIMMYPHNTIEMEQESMFQSEKWIKKILNGFERFDCVDPDPARYVLKKGLSTIMLEFALLSIIATIQFLTIGGWIYLVFCVLAMVLLPISLILYRESKNKIKHNIILAAHDDIRIPAITLRATPEIAEKVREYIEINQSIAWRLKSDYMRSGEYRCRKQRMRNMTWLFCITSSVINIVFLIFIGTI